MTTWLSEGILLLLVIEQELMIETKSDLAVASVSLVDLADLYVIMTINDQRQIINLDILPIQL